MELLNQLKLALLVLSIITKVTVSADTLDIDSNVINHQPADVTLAMLDEINQYMEGKNTHFNRRVYRYIKNCINHLDQRTYFVQGKIWEGLVSYWGTRGRPNDEWAQLQNPYVESNFTVTGKHKMIIFEPCNCASNIAYHHTMLEMCDRRTEVKLKCISRYLTPIRKALAYLVPSSYFHHASRTKLGLALDHRIIDILSFLVHQSLLSNIPYNPILHDLSENPSSMDSIKALEAIEDIYVNKDVLEWDKRLEDLKVPSRYLTISAFIASNMVLNNGLTVINAVGTSLLSLSGINEEHRSFIMDKYIPAFAEAIKNITLTPDQKKDIRSSILKTLGNISTALVWFRGEETFFLPLRYYSIWMGILDRTVIPGVNFVTSNTNTNFHFTTKFQNAKNTFPGEKWCSHTNAHTRWHLQSALAIIDSVKLANDICETIS